MKLADVMDKVEVGMKMVVRSEYNPEYEVFGGKVVEKKGVYLCLEVDGILHGLSAKENYEVLKLFDKNSVELIERDVWEIIEKYVPEVESPEQIYSAALDVWGCYTAEVKRKVSFALAELMTDDDIEWFFDELSDKHRQIANLLGYEDDCENVDEETEDIIDELVENTEAFVRGRKANNCLLFGDAGTGKSSSIKGILNKYYDEGLRIIEVYKHQFVDLNQIIAQIKDRNYKFIIYMDDLSFEEFEIEYKYLKAVIEGGLERKPENILIYATSNRRHLVRERAGDKLEVGADDDIHSSDTVQEKLSLVYRFGVRIYFGAPDRKEFHTIVKTLAQRNGITMPEDELLLEAGKWEISHGGLTGRTAQQFIDHLLGKEETQEA